jgi:hypothetical protein
VGTFAVVDGDSYHLTVGPESGPGGEAPQPDLWALKIGEHTDRATGGVGGGSHPSIGGFVIGMFAVTEVHSGDVHSSLYQRQNQVVGVGCRAKGADDLPASTHDESA